MAKAKKIPLIEDFDNVPAEALVPEEEWPYTIPKHWKWVRLGYVCAINPPKPKVTAYPSTTKVNFIPMACVSELCGSIVKLELRSLDKVSKGYTSFRNNDVILAKITPCFENGKSAVVPKLKYGFGYGSTEFHVLRCGKLLDPRFLHVLVRQPKFIVQGRAVMTGAVGQQRVPRVFLENYPFPLPPIEEQRGIVAYLDEKLGKIDSVCDKLQEFLDQSDIRKDNLIQAGITGHLTSHWREEHKTEVSEDIELAEDSLVPEEEWPYPIPPHWKWVKFGAMNGYLPRNVNPSNQPKTKFLLYSVPAFSSRSAESVLGSEIGSTKQLVDVGDVLVCKINPRINRVWVVRDILPSKTIASSEWIVFRPIMGLPAFYRTYFSSSTFRTKLLSQVSGVGGSLTRARPKLVKEYPVPLAPVAEQKEIVAMLESYLEKESASKKLVFSASKQLDLMRQQLVSVALAGRLTTVLR